MTLDYAGKTVEAVNTYFLQEPEDVLSAPGCQEEDTDLDELPETIEYTGDGRVFIGKFPAEEFRYGSRLIVKEGQEAVFFRDDQPLDLFGPGTYILEKPLLPLMGRAYELTDDAEDAFSSELYFIRKDVQMDFEWSMRPQRVRYDDGYLQVAASGDISLRVTGSRALSVKLCGSMTGLPWEEGSVLSRMIQAVLRPVIAASVSMNLRYALMQNPACVRDPESGPELLSAGLREAVQRDLSVYGLEAAEFRVTDVTLS